jgi:hypothetical protein
MTGHIASHALPSFVTNRISQDIPIVKVVSLKIQGYVQTKNSVPLTTMEKWIGSASWKPLPGGLMSDDDFIANMRRYEN